MTSFAHSPVRPFALSLFLSTLSLAQLPPDHQNAPNALGPDTPAFKVRPGYRVSRALPKTEKRLTNARFLEFSADGKTLFVSQHRRGDLLSLSNPNPEGVYQSVNVFLKNPHSIHGLCYHNGWLYFSDAGDGSVSRARDTNADGVADETQPVLPPKSTPSGGGHPFEGLLVTDDAIYVTASDPTNMTEALDSDRKKIYVFSVPPEHLAPGSTSPFPAESVAKTRKVFSSGVRNTEKLRLRPGTSEIWGLDHGSDNFGKTFGEQTGKVQPITDLNPPEELNHYTQDGFYGHPYITGNKIPRPEFAKRDDLIDLAVKTTPPAWLIHAHWAPNGFTFLSKDTFPNQKGDLVFASHGSWNSAEQPVGAVVQRVLFDQITGLPYGSLTIVDCNAKDRRLARPCDLTESPTDGSLLFTSDEPSALYRITPVKNP